MIKKTQQKCELKIVWKIFYMENLKLAGEYHDQFLAILRLDVFATTSFEYLFFEWNKNLHNLLNSYQSKLIVRQLSEFHTADSQFIIYKSR